MTSFLTEIPKVELHVHLEGAIPLEAFLALVRKYEGNREIASLEALQDRFRYRDFSHFIQTWIWKNGFLREYEDFTFIADKFAEKLGRQKIVYAEAFYSPGDFAARGLEPRQLTEAIHKGLRRHSHKVTVNLVADLVRDHGPEKGARWLREINEVRDLGVIGIGIGGSEQQFPPGAYEEVYEQARNLGFKTSAHAGEAAGADSIWGALTTLGVDRVGHGTRATEDPALLEYMAANRVPVEMCPISNLRTGVIDSLASHPIRRFMELGIPVSVNTDDPEMFNTSLAGEFEALETHLGFTDRDVKTLLLDAVEMAWCPDDVKADLSNRVESFGMDA